MAAGRYPIKACQHILALLESAESNAQFKGLSTADLIVTHISAQKGPDTWRYGRHIRRQAKRTHIEIILEERKKAKEEKPAKKKAAKKEAPKKEAKPAPKAEPKPEVKKEEPKKEEKVEKKQEAPKAKTEAPKAEPKPAVKEEKKQEVKAK